METGTSFEVTFLPADPPRRSRFCFFEPVRAGAKEAARPAAGLTGELEAAAGLTGELEAVELVLPAGGGGRAVRRREVPARLVPVGPAIELLAAARPGEASPSALAWSSALVSGLALLARGRLQPAVTPGGADSWTAGPLD
ncbi:MAG: hypothetical protein ACRD0B_11960, partial [Acidimicrobiales bacterium]